jgi:hypothetical protein
MPLTKFINGTQHESPFVCARHDGEYGHQIDQALSYQDQIRCYASLTQGSDIVSQSIMTRSIIVIVSKTRQLHHVTIKPHRHQRR